MTSCNLNPDKGIESNLAAIDVGYGLLTSDDPVMHSVAPPRVSQHSRLREGSATS